MLEAAGMAGLGAGAPATVGATEPGRAGGVGAVGGLARGGGLGALGGMGGPPLSGFTGGSEPGGFGADVGGTKGFGATGGGVAPVTGFSRVDSFLGTVPGVGGAGTVMRTVSRLVEASAGFGGRVMRTVSFFGAGGGLKPGGLDGVSSAIGEMNMP